MRHSTFVVSAINNQPINSQSDVIFKIVKQSEPYFTISHTLRDQKICTKGHVFEIDRFSINIQHRAYTIFGKSYCVKCLAEALDKLGVLLDIGTFKD